MEYTVAFSTDKGTTKGSNQDSLCIRRAAMPRGGEMVLAVVCDGMGGLSRGELASAEVVRAFGAWFDDNMRELPSACARDFASVKEQWGALIQTLHSRLLAYAQFNGLQLGTTLVAWLAVGDRYLAVSVGDSRLYSHGEKFRQITQDHSLVAREIALGRITQEQANVHPQRNVLLQCLGAGTVVSPEFHEGRVSGGAFYLLCSDGFVHKVEACELERRLLPICVDTQEAMTRALAGIVADCKERGEEDNITAVLVRSVESRLGQGRQGALGRLMGRLKREKDLQGDPEVTLQETVQVVHTQEKL